MKLTKNQMKHHCTATVRSGLGYGLDCISVEREGICQTDGRRLLFIPHDSKAKGPKKRILVDASMSERAIESGRVKPLKRLAKVKYPDWRATMPKADAKGVITTIDPEYLRSLCRALEPEQDPYSSQNGVRMFVPEDPWEPVVLWTHKGASAILMPIDAGRHKLSDCPIVQPAAKAKRATRSAK